MVCTGIEEDGCSANTVGATTAKIESVIRFLEKDMTEAQIQQFGLML